MAKNLTRRWSAVALCALTALALSACSEDTGSSPAPTGGETAKYQKIAEEAMKPVTEFTGPTEGPAAQKGKKIVFLACGFEAEGCNLPGKAAAAAGKALGWDVKVVDGKFDPRIYSRTIQQAIDDGADGVILDAVSASSVAGQVKAAREAGLVVGSYDSFNPVSETGTSYDVNADLDGQGEAMAAYMIWKSDGAANAYILNAPEFQAPAQWIKKSKEVIEACDSCELLGFQDFTAGDAATRLPQLTVTAARQHPDMNVMIAAYDAAMLASIPSMDQAGLLDQVKVGTFNGVSPALDLIRKGQLTASVGGAMEWGVWAAMDNMNRMLAGEEAVEQNVPIRLITAENIDTIEPGGPWTGDIDYTAAYKKIWNAK
ncbi:MAG: substrate-binding domain-containing protein [Nocardioidaceae bacterium]